MPGKGQVEPTVTATDPTTITGPSPFQMLLRKMAGMATIDEASGRMSGEDINPILLAETEDEMWDADELPRYNAKMLSGCQLQILGFDVKYGTGTNEDIKTPFVSPDGKQMYLLVQAVRLNKAGEKKEYRLPEVGQEFTWNTSARNIVGKLFWMLDHGWFDNGHGPVNLRIEGTALQGGKSVEKLKPLTDPTIPAGQPDEIPF